MCKTSVIIEPYFVPFCGKLILDIVMVPTDMKTGFKTEPYFLITELFFNETLLSF